jgi:hypothetical protein
MAFQKYLNSAFIAYDYRDSLLWIFNPQSGFNTYCYLYSIPSGTFSKFNFPKAVTNVVNDYPDYLLHTASEVLSLLGRPDINSLEEQSNSYGATLITRPMKLENAIALKSIMQMRHICQFGAGQGSVMTLHIFASNNLSKWAELHSLRGMPWKYYRFHYDFQNLRATDRFAGTVLVTQERRTDKLR